MSLLAPLAPDSSAPLARFNPVAKISAAVAVLLGLLLTLDPLTPALLLAAELAVVPLTGVSARALSRRCWPLLVGAAGVAVTNLVVVPGGRVLVEIGPWDITSQAVESAVGVSLRLLAIALPGVLVLASTDPMDLADALVQRWHAPARFAYGALAALRLLPLLSADWQQVSRARRARGLDPGGPRWRTCGRSPRRCSRYWSPPYDGGCGWRPRWRRAASERLTWRARSRARSRCWPATGGWWP